MTELAYDERTTNFSTTNNTLFATTGVGAANPIIGGLEVTVTGTGDEVEVEFYVPAVSHTATVPVTAYLVVNGAVNAATSQYRIFSSPLEGGSLKRRLVLTNAVAYTFKVGLYSYAAGIAEAYGSITVGAATAGVMYLRVTG